MTTSKQKNGRKQTQTDTARKLPFQYKTSFISDSAYWMSHLAISGDEDELIKRKRSVT